MALTAGQLCDVFSHGREWTRDCELVFADTGRVRDEVVQLLMFGFVDDSVAAERDALERRMRELLAEDDQIGVPDVVLVRAAAFVRDHPV